MNQKIIRYIWLLLIILFIVIWIKRGEIFRFFQPRPSSESLEFNQPRNPQEIGPRIVSSDEKINMDIFDRVHRAVVNIVATTLGVNFWMEVIPREGQGSGVIIDGKGYILTNNHVVERAQKIVVTLSDGKKIQAKLVGRDPTSDLAVIKIPSRDVEATATLGNSDQIHVGQKAIAIGNPFGFSHTLTTGIVSAVNREIRTKEGTQISGLIQTDAAINPGNSGGPLLNSNGEVIGINTAIFSVSGGYQGIGFAIPINRGKSIATQLIASGRVERPWLGITGVSISADLSRELGLGVDDGVLVVEVLPGSPANQAGLRGGNREAIVGNMRILLGGDVITSLNGKQIRNWKHLVQILSDLRAGETASLQIVRNLVPMELEVLLSERPG